MIKLAKIIPIGLMLINTRKFIEYTLILLPEYAKNMSSLPLLSKQKNLV